MVERLFAVVPAAGHSRRMGQPKLLLPLGEKSVVVRLLDVLGRPEIEETVVVVRPDDERLRAEVETTHARCFQPTVAPPDMRDSVEYGLTEIRRCHSPSATDAWLLVPADHPMLDPVVLDLLLDRWNQNDCQILVPTFEGRRGHPTLFRWKLADKVSDIPSDQGINWIVKQHDHEVTELAIDRRAVVTDLDTPEDYERLLEFWKNR